MKPVVLAALVLLGAAPAAAPAQTNWQLEVGAGRETTSGPDPAWQQQDLALRWRATPRQRLELQTRRATRYGSRDTEIAVGGAVPLGDVWTLAAQAQASPDHRFLPQRGSSLDLTWQGSGGWLAHGGFTTRRFVATDGFTSRADTWRGTVERYVGDWRAAATLSHTLVAGEGDGALGAVLQADRFFGDVARVGVVLASGEELEALPGTLVSSRVHSAALTARLPLAPRWTLVAALVHTRQGDFERRDGGASVLPDRRRTGGRLGVQLDF
jgi:YaiO family outer membrane protein